MARKKRLELTKVPSERGRQRWAKIYQGKKYYFRGEYDDCLKQWHVKLAELEQQETTPSLMVGHWQRLLRNNEAGRPDRFTEAQAKAISETIAGKPKDTIVQITGPIAQEIAPKVIEFRERLSREGKFLQGQLNAIDEIGAYKGPKQPSMVASCVTQFLERQKSKVALGKISAGRFDTLQRNAHHFAKFVGGTTGINSITGLTLVSYHDHLAQEKEANDWTWVYTEMFMRVARQFVQWCNDVDLMDRLPKNLNKEELRFAVPKPKINTFPIDEIKILLANAVDRTKLFLLLMMNTGMQQKDISDLTPDEVDWQTGRITRHRSKLKNGPVISYPLWSKTFELLKKLGNREGDRVLTNEKGLQLKIEELVDGKLRKVDNVAVAYHRLFVKCSSGEKPLLKTKRPLKLLRKTSPSLLNTNIKYKSCAIMFLADSVRGIQPTHYIAPDQATFDEAVLWLGQQYGEG